jgi:hypothetical protein
MMEASRTPTRTHKNLLKITVTASALLVGASFSGGVTLDGLGGVTAISKRKTTRATRKKLSHETPQNVGPSGTIHTPPAHVMSKIMRRKKKNHIAGPGAVLPTMAMIAVNMRAKARPTNRST